MAEERLPRMILVWDNQCTVLQTEDAPNHIGLLFRRRVDDTGFGQDFDVVVVGLRSAWADLADMADDLNRPKDIDSATALHNAFQHVIWESDDVSPENIRRANLEASFQSPLSREAEARVKEALRCAR